MKTMQALVYYGPGDIRLEQRMIPIPAEHEVLVKVRAVSICGSDLGAYKLHTVSERWKPPIILGHEFSGEIAALGNQVKNFYIGQRVTANPILACRDCFYCRRGEYNLCPNRFSIGTSIGGVTHDGAMQEFLTIPDHAIHPLLEGISFEQGALMEPLAVALAASRLGDCGLQESVAVIGAGPIGLMIIKCLKVSGNKKIFASDILSCRIQKAASFGIEGILNGRGDIIEQIKSLTGGLGVDRVLVAVGTNDILEKALQMVINGGIVVVIALMHAKVDLDLFQIVTRQLSILGSYMFTDEISTVIKEVAHGTIVIDDLITSVHPFREGPEIFKELCRSDCEEIKVILTNA